MSPDRSPLPSPVARWRHGLGGLLGVSATVLAVAAVALGGTTPAYAAEATVDLGTAASYAVLAGSAVTNTGPTTVSGDLGVSPGTSVTGFPPGVVTDGTTHAADAAALQAQQDLGTAYDDAAGRSTTTDVTGTDLGGQVLVPGVYAHTSGMQLTGTVTLDAQGDPDAVFIFKAGSTLVTGSGSSVQLINGASPCRVFWQVGSSATLGTGTQFVGSVMALTSATLETGTEVQGRVLARNGAVTLDTNVVAAPSCGVLPTSATPSPTTASPSVTPTVTPTGTPTPTDAPSTTTPADSSTDLTITVPPTIPGGHPHTGRSPEPQPGGPALLLGLAGLAGLGSLFAFSRVLRSPRQH